MKSNVNSTRVLLLFAVSIAGTPAFAQTQPAGLIFNLQQPSSAVVVGGGSFLVAQSSLRPNFGQILFVDQNGDQSPVLLGLPAIGRAQSADPSRAKGLASTGNTIYVAAGQIVPVWAGAASPALGSILRITFSRNLADSPGPFFLQPNDLQTLLGGGRVTLALNADNTAQVSLVANNINAPSDLAIDPSTARLYVTSLVDGSVSWLPLVQ